MAEIKIEKKKPVWPWILLAIVILALILLFAIPWDDDEDEYEGVAEEREMVTTDEKTDVSDEREENQDVISYIEWMDDNLGNMGLDHELTHRALTQLVNATQAMANEINYDVKAELDQAKQYADQIMEEPYETSHAGTIRDAADMISKAMVNMQQAKYPDLEQQAQEVQEAVDQINPEELTLNQKEEVKEFFRKATDLLQEMN